MIPRTVDATYTLVNKIEVFLALRELTIQRMSQITKKQASRPNKRGTIRGVEENERDTCFRWGRQGRSLSGGDI